MLKKIILLLCSILIANSSMAAKPNDKGDYVVVLHGIARSNKHMDKLAKYLASAGYDVINLNYPSTDYKIAELTELINKDISKQVTENKPINFVGYSMGGLMVRALIHKYNYPNLARVVQLAPPNKGSEVADFIKDFWPYQKIYGPAGQQLITDQTEINDLFGKVNFELGIIAGNFTIDPISSSIIPGDDDGKVSIKSTKLEGMKDHIIVSSAHTFFPSNKDVMQQTLYFLNNGEFKHQD